MSAAICRVPPWLNSVRNTEQTRNPVVRANSTVPSVDSESTINTCSGRAQASSAGTNNGQSFAAFNVGIITLNMSVERVIRNQVLNLFLAIITISQQLNERSLPRIFAASVAEGSVFLRPSSSTNLRLKVLDANHARIP